MQSGLVEPTFELDLLFSENHTEPQEDTQEQPNTITISPVQPERGIREIDENIVANNPPESTRRSDTKRACSRDSDRKSDSQAKDPENSVTRLLEKLLAERRHLIELGIIKKELSERHDKENRVADQENVDPTSEGSINPNAKTVKSRQPLNSTIARTPTGIRTIESTLNKYGQYIPTLTSRYNAKKPETHHYYEEESQNSYEESQTEPKETEEEVVEEPIDKKATIKVRLSNMKQAIKPVQLPKITDLIYLSRSQLNFGVTLPGQIMEESVELVNQSNENIVVQILVNCLNTELAETDEYVYAIRRSHSSDYNDKHFVIMSPYSSAQFKIALKTPSVRIKDMIRGETLFSVQGIEESLSITMESKQMIPKLICPKELYNIEFKRNVIKLAVKNYKKLESKIPFRNSSDIPMTLDFEFYKSKESQPCPYDVTCYPASVVINPNALSLINITVKPSPDFHKCEAKPFTRILTAKCRDTTLIYTFIVSIDVCE